MTATSTRDQHAGSALDRRGLLALATGLLVLILVVASSVWQAARNVEALGRVTAAVQTAALLQNVLLAIDDAETGQRGFLLTDEASYVAPFDRAKAGLGDLLDELDGRLARDPKLPMLRRAIAAKMREMQQTVDLAQASNRQEALAIVATDIGRVEMGRIRTLTAELVTQVQTDLTAQSAAIDQGGRRLVAIDAVGLIVVVAVAGLIGLGLRGYLASLAQSRAEAARAYRELAHGHAQLDETVRIRTADLTLANEEIQRFAYIVSHDLRAPLVNIMGFTSELEQAAAILTDYAGLAGWPAAAREAATADIPEALGFIKASTGKMDRLINAILKLSREGRRTLSVETLEMKALLNEMVAAMRHQAKTREVEISIASMPSLAADRVAVEQIFGNVIDNALKYLKPDRPGKIRIDAVKEGSVVHFMITDNGRGIAPRDYERVFELFRRAGDQTVPGEGIGLAHVRALVRRLGGSIFCTSELDVGTVFTITLPVSNAGRGIAA